MSSLLHNIPDDVRSVVRSFKHRTPLMLSIIFNKQQVFGSDSRQYIIHQSGTGDEIRILFGSGTFVMNELFIAPRQLSNYLNLIISNWLPHGPAAYTCHAQFFPSEYHIKDTLALTQQVDIQSFPLYLLYDQNGMVDTHVVTAVGELFGNIYN